MAAEASKPRLPVRVLALSLLGGALGGAGFQAVQARIADAEIRAMPPVVILDVGQAVRAGKDAAAIRAMADRLAGAGLLVLDAQAVLAAPAALYLPQVRVGTR